MTSSSPTDAPVAIDGDLMTRDLEALSRADVAYAGSKGANLGELMGAGLPVPPGFVVGAPAFAAFCEDGGLRERINSRLRFLDIDDSEDLANVAHDVQLMLESEPIPERVEAAIRASYAGLGSEVIPVAVRSSATAEDDDEASFAGMYQTLLDVYDVDQVIAAVRRCWCSLFTARNLFYSGKRGFAFTDLDMAVVVQRQIVATRSGAMTTIDPAAGDRDRLVIEASPDRYLVSKRDRSILAREVGQRDQEATRAVLSDDEVLTLARLGAAIEDHYGAAQQTQWCFDAYGEAWIVRSRPLGASTLNP